MIGWKTGLHIALVRHTESIKTREQRHGGQGQPLTQNGRSDAIDLAKFILLEANRIGSGVSRIYASPVIQVNETASIIHSETDFDITFLDGLRNIDMGVFDGLSDLEIANRFPEPARQLQLWREGKLDVNEVIIPEAEMMDGFRERVRTAFGSIATTKDLDLAIIVITRSVGVALSNILLETTTLKNQPYSRFRFDPGSVSLFNITRPNAARRIYHNRTNFLSREVQYPDE